MLLEAALAYVHLAAILTLVVFMTSQAALCRPQWLNAAVVRRLARLDWICWGAMAAVLASGLARMAWGAKGLAWYAGQPLIQLKIVLFVAMALIARPASAQFRRWRRALDASGALPDVTQVDSARRWVMIESHLLVLLPLAAVLVARGIGTR